MQPREIDAERKHLAAESRRTKPVTPSQAPCLSLSWLQHWRSHIATARCWVTPGKPWPRAGSLVFLRNRARRSDRAALVPELRDRTRNCADTITADEKYFANRAGNGPQPRAEKRPSLHRYRHTIVRSRSHRLARTYDSPSGHAPAPLRLGATGRDCAKPNSSGAETYHPRPA